jgi:transposase
MPNATTTVLQQLMHLLPRDDFQSFVGQHKADKYAKRLNCWNQLTILLYAQATEKDSLREIETGLLVQSERWYHLGLRTCARSTLSRANEKRPWSLYESLFYKLLSRCKNLGSGTEPFAFRNDLYAIDSTTVDLCLSVFPWARFRTEKGAIKLHTLFNVRTQIPELILVTDGKVSDIKAAQGIDLSAYSKGSIFVFDRGYNDYSFLRKIKSAGHHFVIRLKTNANLVHLGQHRKALGKGVLKDERAAFILEKAQADYPDDLRLVTFHDDEHNVTYEFLTDHFRFSAANIALIYKKRWAIELFFKWIKQHLRIKTFLGTSKNAVLTQIWVAMIYYLLLAWVKHQTHFAGSLHTLTVMIKELILQAVQIIEILRLTPETVSRALSRGSRQLSLF